MNTTGKKNLTFSLKRYFLGLFRIERGKLFWRSEQKEKITQIKQMVMVNS
uniref:Uncharacterized protein n=1 Tax=Escherichia coli TaxID=562 RepID=A0A7L8K8V0_ECOLX|nr:hypothetical protein TP123_49 [Escherichia coli]UWM22065.1 hypothetical protein [Morganella morganii]UWM22366.1 hypothetical protein [Klebsiella pneumoniae]UMW91676.1 hypothetical protein [Escherichia coli]UNS24856.1 hypothetical protein [Escherichia coli]